MEKDFKKKFSQVRPMIDSKLLINSNHALMHVQLNIQHLLYGTLVHLFEDGG